MRWIFTTFRLQPHDGNGKGFELRRELEELREQIDVVVALGDGRVALIELKSALRDEFLRPAERAQMLNYLGALEAEFGSTEEALRQWQEAFDAAETSDQIELGAYLEANIASLISE